LWRLKTTKLPFNNVTGSTYFLQINHTQKFQNSLFTHTKEWFVWDMNLMSGYKTVSHICITQTGHIDSTDILKNTTHCYSISHGQKRLLEDCT
jgi:hypothetical protein